MVWPLFRYIVKAAIRDRLFLSFLGVLVVIFSLAYFFGSSALIEKEQFARVTAAFGFRLCGVVGLVLFTVIFIRRCFEARDVEYLLSRPVSRLQYVLTHAAGLSFIAFLAALLLGGCTILLEIGALQTGAFLWWASIAVEYILMVNVAMFFSFVMTSPSAATLVVLAFYLLARLMGQLHGIINAYPMKGVFNMLQHAMDLISIFIPRLDLMGQTKWLLYGPSPEISFGFVLAQGAVFLTLIISATLFDMSRRQF